jgi:hypothetical protein
MVARSLAFAGNKLTTFPMPIMKIGIDGPGHVAFGEGVVDMDVSRPEVIERF